MLDLTFQQWRKVGMVVVATIITTFIIAVSRLDLKLDLNPNPDIRIPAGHYQDESVVSHHPLVSHPPTKSIVNLRVDLDPVGPKIKPLELAVSTGAVFPALGAPPLNDTGPTSATAASCTSFGWQTLQLYHERSYIELLRQIDFKGGPKYNMPWYFDDPFPLCGRYLLDYFTGGTAVHLHRLELPPLAATGTDSITSRPSVSHQDPTLRVPTQSRTMVLPIRDCGGCTRGYGGCSADLFITARLVGQEGYQSLKVRSVTDPTGGSHQAVELFPVVEPGEYQLEVKLVHLNGTSTDPRDPKSLGIIGIRTFENKRKSYRYNTICNNQRHVYGSPLRVRVTRPETLTYSKETPFCVVANHSEGRWVRFSPTSCNSKSNPFCFGDPSWLNDACAFNKDFLWAPLGCKFQFWSPPHGPLQKCIRAPSRGLLMLVGDSVTREYAMNCALFDLKAAKLECLFNNIAMEGKHYSKDYAIAVAKVIIDNIRTNNPSVFATNLGIHHVIGPCTTGQWTEFIDIFASLWRANISWASFSDDQHGGSVELKTKWRLEKAIWLGPPTIQYARLGMGPQRAAEWDAIAWARLESLGFQRLYAIAPTASREESTWDGLHYAAQKGKVQSPWRNKDVQPGKWNGGVANMLFTMLLNLICNSVSK